MLKLKTKSATYDVVKNEDGTLTILLSNEPVRYADQIIKDMGGVDAVLARCKEYTEDEWQAKKAADKAARKAEHLAGIRMTEEYAAKHEDEYNAIFGDSRVHGRERPAAAHTPQRPQLGHVAFAQNERRLYLQPVRLWRHESNGNQAGQSD